MVRTSIRRDRSSGAVAPYFEFCVHGRPISAQAHNRQRLNAWRNQVREAAMAVWPRNAPALTVAVELWITHYAEKRIADMDNLIKPIQDALQGTAYLDDSMVVDVTGSWRDINSRLPVRFMPLPLATAFSDGREFVHIRLWVTPSRQELS
jgi:crossover junction endodeoxyribonuclease RusA